MIVGRGTSASVITEGESAVRKIQCLFQGWEDEDYGWRINEQCVIETSVLQRLKGGHPSLPVLSSIELKEGAVALPVPMPQLHIVMPHYGRTLDSLKKLSEPELVELAWQMCDVGAYLEQKGVVHVDIKANNILLKPDAQGVKVTLVDYGLAWMMSPDIMGTGIYSNTCMAAPELLMAEPITPKADVWSLGVILYERIIGTKAMFDETSEDDALRDIISSLKPTLRKQDKDCLGGSKPRPRMHFTKKMAKTGYSEALRDLVTQMMAFYPDERPSFSQCLEHRIFSGRKRTGMSKDGGEEEAPPSVAVDPPRRDSTSAKVAREARKHHSPGLEAKALEVYHRYRDLDGDTTDTNTLVEACIMLASTMTPRSVGASSPIESNKSRLLMDKISSIYVTLGYRI